MNATHPASYTAQTEIFYKIIAQGIAKLKKMDEKEKKHLHESLDTAKLENKKLKTLLIDLDKYLNELEYLFEDYEDNRFYNKEITPEELNDFFERAKKLFLEVKSIEKVENLETVELKNLLDDMKNGNYGDSAKDISKDINLQQEIDNETEILEKFFSEVLSYFKLIILEPEKIEDPMQGKNYIIGFFRTAHLTVSKEIEQSDKEIQELEKEQKDI